MEHAKGDLYIGRLSETGEPFAYDADNFTTHGVIVGMTGSGKTGLGVNILEEALLSDIPTLVIDPKGDMGNLILNFPDHRPEDYESWVDEAKATRKGLSVPQLAAETAEKRRAKLLEHGLTSERMRQLKEGTEITLYTPGSSAGVGLNVLGSLLATDLDWEENAEIIRDEIEGFVSSLLVLAGIDSDPVSGPEHILLATIIETWWKQGKDLDLATLIGQIPQPPFRKLGVFDIDTFIPEKDRTDLALRLNGLLASPSFAPWLDGVPLDIEDLIGSGGKTKCAVIYMAHLTESERQFLTTLLLSKLVTWMRKQPGSSELRALVYLDEAVGYLPPTAEPPSKKPIMTILKQARAFGVGMLLVTQNPVDLDYKAMSNSGTWIVGRLQTENDKRRILEGMQTIDNADGTTGLDTLVSALEKRQFILHSAKKHQPKLFKRRRSISYRIGPLTRDQVSLLMKDKKSHQVHHSPQTAAEPSSETTSVAADKSGVPIAPAVAEGTKVAYLNPGAPWLAELGFDQTGRELEPAVAATVQLLYDDTNAGINHSEVYEAIIYPVDGIIDLSDITAVDHDERDFLVEPPLGAIYGVPDVKLQNKTFWTALAADLRNHLVANRRLQVMRNPELGLYSRVEESIEEFGTRLERAASDAADAEMAKLKERYKTRIARVQGQISTAETRVAELEGDASAKKQDELLSGAGDLLGALLGGRKSSNPLGKAASRRSAAHKARVRADAAAARVADKESELVELEDELADALAEIDERYAAMVDSVEPVEIGLEKTDVRVAELKLVWVPTG